MAPVTQYVFAEMLVISEHFAAGSHEWLPYSVIPAFSKQIGKHQSVVQMYFMCHPGKAPRLPGVTCFLENALNGQFPGFRQNGYKKTGALPRNCGKYSLTIVSK